MRGADVPGDEQAMITVDDSLIRMHPHDDVMLLPLSRPKVSFDERNKPPLCKTCSRDIRLWNFWNIRDTLGLNFFNEVRKM